jgi:hypothetical protein
MSGKGKFETGSTSERSDERRKLNPPRTTHLSVIMKKYCAWILCVASASVGLRAAEERTQPSVPSRAANVATTEIGKPQIVERWSDGRIWQRITTQTLKNGGTILHTNRWTDFATGIHYWDVNHWRESRAEFSITPNGAEARQGPHKAFLAGNINSAGAITITSPDGKTLRSHVVGLAYTDLATGESVLIATVRDSIGQLFPPNQVLYPSAFNGIVADLRYVYTKQGFEQDVILRESPPPPSDYGLNNETTALEVWTEFEAPEPQRIPAVAPAGLSDETLSFGKLRIARGGAFAIDAPEPRMSAAPVGKTWLNANNRQYLIESVRHRGVEGELNKLPPLQAANQRGAGAPAVARVEKKTRLAWLNTQETRRAAVPTPVRMAVDKSLINSGPGLVLDYIIYGGDTNEITFQADTTYLISDGFSIWNTATIEGNTVIKIGTTNPTVIQFFGDIVMKTDPYRPAIFTSQNDTTVGLDFTAPGSPAKYHGAIACAGYDLSFKHLRISHAQYGLQTYSMNLIDAQFTDCDRAFYSHYYPINVDNVLFHRVGRVFAGSAYTARARNITVNQCAQLSDDFANPAYSQVAITNSLLVNVTNLGTVSLTTNYTVTTTNNVFQTVGAGAHYLATNSIYRDAGTTNIPAALAARLRKTTTYPPLVIAPVGGYYGVSQTLSPRCGWDTDAPDLGYHYNPIDYALSFVYLTNATITVEPGTAIAFFNPTNISSYGIALGEGGRLLCQGNANAKINLTQYATVQEMANTNWAGP